MEFIIVFKNTVPYTYNKQEIFKEYGIEEKLLIEKFNYSIFEEIENKRLRPIKAQFEKLKKSHLAKYRNQKEINIVGFGTFGKVYAFGDSPIVCKESDLENCEHDYFSVSLNEIGVQSYVSQLLDYKITPQKSLIYLQRYKSDLTDYVNKKSFKGKEKEIIFTLLKKGYDMYKKGIAHLDIKFENILTDGKSVTFADFGLAAFFPYSGRFDNTAAVTAGYRAPEIYRYHEYDSSVDIFALGIIFLELFKNTTHVIHKFHELTLRQNSLKNVEIHDKFYFTKTVSFLYQIKSLEELDEKGKIILTDTCDIIDDFYGSILCMQMLSNNPKMRPTFAEALNHPFFDDIRDKPEKELSYEDIISELPELNLSPRKITFSEKYTLFSRMVRLAKACKYNINTLFLTLRFFNVYTGPITGEFKIEACAFLAAILTSDMNYTIEDMSDFLKVDAKSFQKMVIDLFYFLESNRVLYAKLPFMYIQNDDITEKILEKLFMIELFYEETYQLSTETIGCVISGRVKNPIIEKIITDTTKIFYTKNQHDLPLPLSSVVRVLSQLKTVKNGLQQRDHSLDTIFIKNMESKFTKGNLILQNTELRKAIIEMGDYV